MLRNLLILCFAAAVFWLAVDLMLREQRSTPEPVSVPQAELEPIVPPPLDDQPNRVADISVHTREELEILFDRVEQLLERPRNKDEGPLISLVLHGQEVEFFVLENYAENKAIVDRAAKLAALGAVDISICETKMRNLGIAADQVPAFLRQVPFGPDEVSRLLDKGYVSM